MTPWHELLGAFTLLTRFPTGRLSTVQPPPGACIWAYPLVGAAVGSLGAAMFVLARLVLPPTIAALLAIAATILATGALHEDGLADTADGFGGGTTPERKLDIMRDSRIGSYGALALMLSLGVRVTAIATLASPNRAAYALIAAGALGRLAMLVPLWRLTPARQTGLGAALGRPAARSLAIGLACAAPFAVPAPATLLAALGAGAIVTWLARRQVGGYTGDVLGATEQLAETAILVTLLIGGR